MVPDKDASCRSRDEYERAKVDITQYSNTQDI